ncbi:purine-binding chemotaxis protein CheW [Massilia forsythiae]|uniref:Purine-binding chemotaxis protein CheW n=1 Tax=Massilia forsythiae TaxID=2728020 RepID=A0A7Z2VXD4_9BURK|nr:chemotaxis protein CheW [Massilia forsythiae]QJE01193.1 purine-binding chemotaxis protein CheW [Massilia forsythiae]
MTTASQAPAPATAPEAAATAQYLTFALGGEAFGIGIMAVKEIIEFGNVTEVPMMPPSIRGVINLRGAVVPVLDLAARFGRAPAVPGRRTCIVIVELAAPDGPQVTGVIVDAVSAVLDIPAAEIEPAPAFGTRIHGDYIAGMGKVNGGFVILLDVAQVLVLDDAPEPAAPAALAA